MNGEIRWSEKKEMQRKRVLEIKRTVKRGKYELVRERERERKIEMKRER